MIVLVLLLSVYGEPDIVLERSWHRDLSACIAAQREAVERIEERVADRAYRERLPLERYQLSAECWSMPMEAK